ncbi:hypothetical protein OF83DRAFT_1036918, partial [Amylostereum chailletii]
QYPPAAYTLDPITDAQVDKAIKCLHPFKAPGEDGIPNTVWMQNRDIITPWLSRFYRGTFTLKYYPQ